MNQMNIVVSYLRKKALVSNDAASGIPGVDYAIGPDARRKQQEVMNYAKGHSDFFGPNQKLPEVPISVEYIPREEPSHTFFELPTILQRYVLEQAERAQAASIYEVSPLVEATAEWAKRHPDELENLKQELSSSDYAKELTAEELLQWT